MHRQKGRREVREANSLIHIRTYRSTQKYKYNSKLIQWEEWALVQGATKHKCTANTPPITTLKLFFSFLFLYEQSTYSFQSICCRPKSSWLLCTLEGLYLWTGELAPCQLQIHCFFFFSFFRRRNRRGWGKLWKK